MVSERPWRVEAVLLLGAGLLLTLSLSLIALYLVEHFLGEHRFMMFVASTVNVQVFVVVMIHFFLRYHRVTWREFLLGGSRQAFRAAGLGVVIALFALPGAWLLNYLSAQAMTWVRMVPKEQAIVEVLESAKDPLQQGIFGFAAIVLAPLIEEALFRGILYPAVKQRGYPIVALVGTSVLFAAIHGNVMTFLPLFFLALVLIGLYELTGSLAAPIAAHAVFNSINFLLFLFRPEINRWLDLDHLR